MAHFLNLIFVKNMAQIDLLHCLVVACELYCWKCELCLLHIVVYSLIEVLTHVGFEYHWEMIAVPLALISALYRLSCYCKVLLTFNRRISVSR